MLMLVQLRLALVVVLMLMLEQLRLALVVVLMLMLEQLRLALVVVLMLTLAITCQVLVLFGQGKRVDTLSASGGNVYGKQTVKTTAQIIK
jgi:hypothetical protein